MTDNQQIVLQLLSEIDRLCTEHGWSYFLGNRYILAAARSGCFENDNVGFTVIMPVKDFVQFAKMSDELPKDRYVESLYNNERYPSTDMMFGSSNTTDINTNTFGFYNHNGIHVTIVPLRFSDKNAIRERIRRIAENSWETYSDYRREGLKREKAYKLMRTFTGIMGRKRASKILFNFLLTTKINKRNGDLYTRRYWNVRPREIDGRFFDDYTKLKFEGLELRVPKDYKNYLTEVYGDKWEDVEIMPLIENPVFRIIDSNIPYEELLEEAKAEGVDYAELWKERNRFVKIDRRLAYLRFVRNRYWNEMFLSCDRYYCWNIYKDKIGELRKLRDAGDAAALLKELETYIELINKNNENRLGLCFDKEVFEMLEYAYEATGNDYRCRWMQNVRRRVPDEHWEPITLKDYKENVIETAQEGDIV